MNDPNSPSLSTASGAPPPPTAQSHSAAQLHEHPLWAAAAGRGRGRGMPPPASRGRGGRAGRGGGRGAAQQLEDDGGSTRYERISLLAQELQGCATGGDDADSAFCSDDAASDKEHGTKRPHGRGVTASDDDDEDMEYEDPDGEEGETHADGMSALQTSGDESDDERDRDAKKQRRSRATRKRQRAKRRPSEGTGGTATSAADMMAAAAFGGRSRAFGDVTSDDESQVSRTSSKRKRDAHAQAFPVNGVHCVGCALANRIGPVERFVNQNVGRQAEKALWKFAALTWQKEVVEPARREGVHVVGWGWRDIANHFRLHTTSAVVGRTAMIQTLTAMRCQIEGTLVRNDNGERTLDKANAELALKILAAESRERQLLQADKPGQVGTRGRGTAQKPAGGDE